MVEAFDIRPAVKEQIQSLGATFIEIGEIKEETQDKGGYAKEISAETQKREEEVIHKHVKEADIVVTTAQIPETGTPTGH